MRLIKGIDIDRINTRFSIDFQNQFEHSLHSLEKGGYIINDNSVIRVTEKGLYMLDTITEELIFCD
tara:strand:- start:816 stop:1013 length:198 start_codon:yes stop_codon:yes gene_type:complete